MIIDAGSITWLVLGALILGAVAVVLDRVNFPQKPFRPKRIQTPRQGSSRDRTGAHIIDEDEDENEDEDEDEHEHESGVESGDSVSEAGTDE